MLNPASEIKRLRIELRYCCPDDTDIGEHPCQGAEIGRRCHSFDERRIVGPFREPLDDMSRALDEGIADRRLPSESDFRRVPSLDHDASQVSLV
jgi:hypothetical protein